jgi:hypothetical protein
MSFSSWLRIWNRSDAGERRRSYGAPRKRPTYGLRVEALEDRWLPSTLTVLNNLDHGPGSLRAKIAAANPGDQIIFAKSVHAITLSSGQLVIGKSLDIEGPGADNLTVSGNDANRIFDISGGPTVTIAGLTITDGLAQGSGTGGGILNEPGANLHLRDISFTDNRALADVGGAIWNVDGATATVDACLFNNNLVVGFHGSAEGGAIDNDGTMSVASSTFTGNQAIGADGAVRGNGHGGGIGNDGTLSVTGCTFGANKALAGAVANGVTVQAQGLGGAIDNFGALTVSSSVFADNLAVGGPGATSLPSPRAFAGVGGAIQSISGTVTVSCSSFSNNQAIGGAGGDGGPGSVAFAGGLDVSHGCVLTLSDSTFSNNAAIGGAGGSGAVGGNAVGGGVSVDSGSTATITNITVSHNQALGGAGGHGANGGNAWAGGLAVGGFSTFGISDSASVSLSDGTLSDNLAIGGNGGSGGNGGNGSGGGVFIGTGAALTVTGSTITMNHANGGSGSGGGSDGQGVGGGVYSLGAFSAVDTVIAGNHASTSSDDLST